jgi:arylsulfatase A-like enzyme
MSDTSTRPNVVFILTDDQGYGDLSCLGNPVIKTPAIDRLYSDSVRLSQFHVAPVCTPTRGELMTGRDALYNGATFVCMGRSLLRADLPTMADIFAENDYHTGHFGKWHLGDNYPYRPQDRGFHETVYHPAWGITSAPDYFENDYFDDHYRHRDEIEQYRGYCTDVWFNEATRWIDGCRSRDERFFAYIATNAPHGPLWVPNEYRDPYRGSSVRGVDMDVASFYGMIANIDENIGRLESYLASSGLLDNTIFIFMTDNGSASGSSVYNAGMRGCKKSLYDGGHRVPCFIRWPDGNIGGGRDVDGISRSTDVLPTLIDLCGLSVPDGLEFDGIPLSSAITEGQAIDQSRTEVIQYGHANEGIWGYSPKSTASVLRGNWRLVNGTELYDIGVDPGQINDLFDAFPDVVAGMSDAYDRWWDRVAGNLAKYQPLVIGNSAENPMRLCSADWAWVYADNPACIRGCTMDSGTWHVDIAKNGEYAFQLRRWPEESGLGIDMPAPVMHGVDGDLPAGRALPVDSAWLQVGRIEQTMKIDPHGQSVTFTMPCTAGPAHIRSWWIDDKGNQLAGAYFLSVERLQS